MQEGKFTNTHYAVTILQNDYLAQRTIGGLQTTLLNTFFNNRKSSSKNSFKGSRF